MRQMIEGAYDTLPIISTSPNASLSRVRIIPLKASRWRSSDRCACALACSSCSSCQTAVSRGSLLTGRIFRNPPVQPNLLN